MDNPYATQQTDPSTPPDMHGNTAITPNVIQALAGTKPWVRLCSILGFIGSGLMIIAGALMILGSAFMGAAMTQTDAGAAGGLAGAPLFLFSIIYLVMGVIYLIPSIKLWKYGSHILSLMHSQSTLDLEAALDAQRSFWKFVGIMVCIMIGLYIIGMIVAVVASVALSGSF